MFREFDYAINFIADFLESHSFPGLYTKLAEAYTKANQQNTEELQSEINTTRKQILNAHGSIDLASWPEGRLEALDRLEATELLGQNAIKRIRKIYSENQGNTPAVIEGFRKIQSETQNLIQRVNRLKTDFSVPTKEELEPETGMSIFEVSFENDEQLENWKQFKEKGNEWWYITHTFAWMTGTSVEDVKFISAGKGSFFTSCLANIDYVNAFMQAILLILELRHFYLEVWGMKKKAKDMALDEQDGIKVDFDGIDIQYEKWLKVKIDKLSVQVMEKHLTKKIKEETVRNELKGFLKRALNIMYLFTVKGGKVTQPTPKKVEISNKEFTLGQVYDEIKKLRSEVQPLLLENKQEQVEEKMHEEATAITPEEVEKLEASGKYPEPDKEEKPIEEKKSKKEKKKKATKKKASK